MYLLQFVSYDKKGDSKPFNGVRRKFFIGGVSFGGIWWPVVFGVRCL